MDGMIDQLIDWSIDCVIGWVGEWAIEYKKSYVDNQFLDGILHVPCLYRSFVSKILIPSYFFAPPTSDWSHRNSLSL